MQSTNHFALLWSLGYHRMCPIVPPGAPLSERSSLYRRLHAKNPHDERGKAPGKRWPDGTWSGFDFVAHESTEADCETWHAMGASLGIKTGRGLVLIDADTKNEALAQIIRDTIAVQVGPLPVRIGNYPKAGYLVRTDPDFQYTRIEFGERDDKGRLLERVEILAEGRQFVAVGTHPTTMQPYRWPAGIPALADVPFVSGEALLGLLEALRPLLPAASEIVREGAQTDVEQETLRADIALIRRAVEATPNTSSAFPTRESYRDFGYAIKAAAGPDHEREAFEMYADWCGRWEEGENDPDIVAADWHRMKPPFRRGASWLFEQATEHGDGSFNGVAIQWFEEPSNEAPLFPEILPNDFSTRRFSFTSFGDAASSALSTATLPLVKGVLNQGAMTVLYGESNAGKTFVAMDLAYHIARGLPWAGKRTAGLPVLYIAAEGGQGARLRAAALASRHGPATGFWFLMHPINLLRADADLRPLVVSIKATGESFGLIVVDTLSRAMAGGDENASTDMGAMVKHLDVLRSETSAHVLTVHHSGKDRAKGARGHSLLRAATDTEIEVVNGEIVVTKQRDLDGSFSSAFGLDVVTLGVDADGDPITSCTVRLVGRDDVAVAPVGNLTPKEAAVLSAVEELTGMDAGKFGVGLDELVVYFEQAEDKLSKENVRFHLRALLAKKHVKRAGRGKYTSRTEEMASSVTETKRFFENVTEESGGRTEENIFE